MAKYQNKANALDYQNEEELNSAVESQKRKKIKKNKFPESVVEDEQVMNADSPLVGGNSKYSELKPASGKKKIKKKSSGETTIRKEGSKKFGVEKEKERRKKRKEQLFEGISEDEDGQNINRGESPEVLYPPAEREIGDQEEQLLDDAAVTNEGQEIGGINLVEEEHEILNDEMVDCLNKKKKKGRLLKEAAKADRRGICYLSRIPPHMDHVKLRHILSQYGEIQRIYLAPEVGVNKHRVQRKKADGFQDQEFSEGWVEFTNKNIAKRVANMLNGEQIGGKKRSKFYYDLWNIKYLSKFKWDDLTEEIAYKSAVREQKLALELSAAKRERDFYLSKVEKSRALSSIDERLKKKQKVQEERGGQLSVNRKAPKVIRQFPQTKPVGDKTAKHKAQLCKDFLAGVFGSAQL